MSVRAATRNRQHETPKESFFGRLLDPIDLLSEAIFSVLIVLMFTLAFRIMTLGANPTQPVTSSYINDLLIAAASATIAWGTIDGIMYALMSMFARGETHRMQQQIQLAETEEEAIQIVADELDYVLEPISGEVQRRRLYQDVLEHLHDGTPPTIRLSREDIAGGLGSVLVAVLAVLPSLAPLLLFYNEPVFAIRMSNFVSFVVLFVAGYQWGKYTGASSWGAGLVLVGAGAFMVLIALLLGGK